MDRFIITSWDDGNQLDMELADLLLKYKIPAVFYIPVNGDLIDYQIKCLSGMGICPISQKTKGLFEIGAHTITHPRDLRDISEEEAWKEISESKVIIEKITGLPVTKFCYPRGRYDDKIKELVKKAGFKEARLTKGMSIDFPKDLFETRPTIHVHPDKPEYNGKTWKDEAHRLFDIVIEQGGRFELWGHSWEIERYNQWEFLEDFLYYMDKRMTEINYQRHRIIS
jgi:peptidoglycan/xylan/chitin deacetylase (PgdA/CDA1 family)